MDTIMTKMLTKQKQTEVKCCIYVDLYLNNKYDNNVKNKTKTI
ncbi:hypothetical protein SAMN05443253_101398 [Bacillus sp. OK048]|nr:hypothetical protein SAMN05443253_101398 [Bacillus sp. OK048]